MNCGCFSVMLEQSWSRSPGRALGGAELSPRVPGGAWDSWVSDPNHHRHLETGGKGTHRGCLNLVLAMCRAAEMSTSGGQGSQRQRLSSPPRLSPSPESQWPHPSGTTEAHGAGARGARAMLAPAAWSRGRGWSPGWYLGSQ